MDFRNLFPSYWDLKKWTLEIKILNNVVSDTNSFSKKKKKIQIYNGSVIEPQVKAL